MQNHTAQPEALPDLREGRCPQRPYIFLQIVPYFISSTRLAGTLALHSQRLIAFSACGTARRAL